MTLFFQLLLAGIMVGGIYALIAMGFTLIYRSTGIINVAQGGFVMVGAYVAYDLITRGGLPFPLACVLTAVIGIVLGVVVERVFLRPMIGQPILGIVMMTIGLLIVVEGLVVPIWGPDYCSFPQVLPSQPLQFFGLSLSYVQLVGFAIAMILFAGLAAMVRFTRLGVHMRAVAEDTQAAEAAGIQVRRIFSVAWGVGTMVATVGGIVLGMIINVYPGLSFIGLMALPAVIIGGMESIPGAMVGGLTIGVLQYVGGTYVERYLHLEAFSDVFPFIVLLLVLMIRPYGFFGWQRIRRI